MAQRTTDALVKETLRLGSQGGDYDDANNPSLARYIKAATLITDRVATCATDRGMALTADELAEIETWLAAHMYVMSDQNYAANSTADASATYQGKTEKRLEASKYGQMALAMDYSGCLAAISNRAFASMVWGGKAPSEQTAYEDRD